MEMGTGFDIVDTFSLPFDLEKDENQDRLGGEAVGGSFRAVSCKGSGTESVDVVSGGTKGIGDVSGESDIGLSMMVSDTGDSETTGVQ